MEKKALIGFVPVALFCVSGVIFAAEKGRFARPKSVMLPIKQEVAVVDLKTRAERNIAYDAKTTVGELEQSVAKEFGLDIKNFELLFKGISVPKKDAVLATILSMTGLKKVELKPIYVIRIKDRESKVVQEIPYKEGMTVAEVKEFIAGKLVKDIRALDLYDWDGKLIDDTSAYTFLVDWVVLSKRGGQPGEVHYSYMVRMMPPQPSHSSLTESALRRSPAERIDEEASSTTPVLQTSKTSISGKRPERVDILQVRVERLEREFENLKQKVESLSRSQSAASNDDVAFLPPPDDVPMPDDFLKVR